MTRKSRIQERLDRAQSDYDAMAAKKSRSGTRWTEADYKAAGIQLLHLRLKPEHHEPLDELAGQWGVSRGEAAKRAIAEAHARHVAPYGRPPVEIPAEPEASAVVAKPLNERAGKRKSDKSEG